MSNDSIPSGAGPTWSNPDAIPNTVYKFIEPPYADSFAQGVVRIGTFRGYAEIDNARADKGEATFVHLVDRATFTAGNPWNAKLGFDIRDQAKIFVDGGQYIERAPDMYCFCASKSKLSAPKFPHVVFQISDYPEFIRTLMDQNFLKLGPSGHLGEVRYLPRSGAYDDPTPGQADPFVKETSFSWEDEFRTVWDQHSGDPKPFLTVADPKLAAFIKRL